MSYKVHARVPSDGELDALAGVPTADGGNPLVTLQDRRLVANGGVAGAIASASVFGSGRDGDLVFNGSAVTGFDLTGTDYVRNLKYDLHARSITVSNGYSIDMAGTRLRAFVGTLGNNVRIHNDASYCDIYSTLNYVVPYTALPCVNIATSTGAIFHGGNSGQTPNIIVTETTGGAGSARSYRGLMVGGSSYPGGRISQIAGLAAATANPTLTNRMTGLSSHFYGDLFEMILGSFPYARNGSSILALSGGLGGGRGYYGTSSGDSTASPSGAGGGGVIGIAIKDLTCGSDCVFSANGGSCADAFSILVGATSNLPSMIGGSSGGGGGAIAVLIGQITGDYLPAVEAKGGNGGAGAFTLGTTTNTDTYLTDGGSGGDGGKVMLYIGFNLVGGTPTIDVSGGTKGTSQAGATPTYSSINVDGATGLYHYYQAA